MTTHAANDQAAGLRALMHALRPPAPAHGPSHPRFGPGPGPSQRRARIITVASGKGGVGKSNLAVNLAIALSRSAHRVALLDADLGVANADLLCGLSPSRRVDRVLDKAGPTLADLAIDAPGGFRLIPGSVGWARAVDLPPADRDILLARLADLHASTDVLIIDAGAGVGALVRALVNASDQAILVTTPEPTALADAYALVKIVASEQPAPAEPSALRPLWRLIVNQARTAEEARVVHTRLETATTRFLGRSVPLLGWVPADAQVPAAVRARTPVLLHAPESAASRSICELAAVLVPKPARLQPVASIPIRLGGWFGAKLTRRG